MAGDCKTLNDFIKIHHIRTHARKKPTGISSNFEEFQRVYEDVLTGVGNKDGKFYKARNSILKNDDNIIRSRTTMDNVPTPRKNIKTIKLELPLFGTEKAIVTPKHKIIRPAKKTIIKRTLETTDQELTDKEKQYVTANKRRTESKTITQSCSLNLTKRSPLLLDNNNKDNEQIKLQLSKMKCLTESKKQASRAKSPSYKPRTMRRKVDRHRCCMDKRYANTISTIKEKLKKLEAKYFKKPQIVYRTVNEICTQSSNIDVLYSNSLGSASINISETFKDIKDGLNNMANINIESNRSLHKKLSFKKSHSNDNLETNSYSHIINKTESTLKKFRTIKQEIIDVEAFCKELTNLGDDVAENTGLINKIQEPRHNETPGENGDAHKTIFDDSPLQQSVMKSTYLMNEFGIKPKVKVFYDRDSKYITSRHKLLEATKSCNKSGESSVTNMYKQLNFALENSIYQAAKK